MSKFSEFNVLPQEDIQRIFSLRTEQMPEIVPFLDDEIAAAAIKQFLQYAAEAVDEGLVVSMVEVGKICDYLKLAAARCCRSEDDALWSADQSMEFGCNNLEKFFAGKLPAKSQQA